MSNLQKQRAGRGRLRPPEDRARKDRRLGTPIAVEEPLGACPGREPYMVKRWWRKCERDWPQLNRRDRQHLLEYCRLRMRLDEVARRIGDELTATNRHGETVPHPLLTHQRQLEARADRMVRDFAGTAGTRERARPAPGEAQSAPVLSLLERGKPR